MTMDRNIFTPDRAALAVGQTYRCGGDDSSAPRTISEISDGGDHLAWESADGHYGTIHVQQFVNFATGVDGGLMAQ